jgi:MFS family permease
VARTWRCRYARRPVNAPDQAPMSPTTRAAIAMVMVNAVATPLMLSSVNVALPAIARDLVLDAVTLTWVPLAYLVAAVALVLPAGRVADHIGRRRVFIAGTLGVIVSSFAAAAAGDGAAFLASRVAQGLFTALLYATQVAIISSVVAPARRGQYIGYTVACVYVGLTAGPALGGWMVDAWHWRAALLVHVPLSALSCLIGLTLARTEWKSDHPQPVDPFGSLLYGGGLALLLVGLANALNGPLVLLAPAGVLALFLFTRHEARVPSPLIDIPLLLGQARLRAAVIAAFLMYAATFGNVVLVSLQLQYLEGASAFAAGQVMLVQPLTMTLLAPVFGRLSDVLDARLLTSSGTVFALIGLLLLAFNAGSHSHALLLTGLLAVGLGFSLFSAPNTNALMSGVPKARYGAAAGIVATTRLLGQLTSQGVVVIVFALVIGHVPLAEGNREALAEAVRIAYGLAAVLCLPALWFTGRGLFARPEAAA